MQLHLPDLHQMLSHVHLPHLPHLDVAQYLPSLPPELLHHIAAAKAFLDSLEVTEFVGLTVAAPALVVWVAITVYEMMNDWFNWGFALPY